MIEYVGLAGAYVGSWYLFWRLKLRRPPKRILTFHDISDGFDLSITRLGSGGFRKIIEYISESGLGGVNLSGQRKEKDIGLTFDDGWQSFYTIAYPILKEFGFSATLFVIPGYMGKMSSWDYAKRNHLRWNEIQALTDEGIEIASHSVNHVDLRGLNDRQLEHEVADSKKEIEDKIGRPVKYFSYPYGRYNQRVIEAVKRAGYEKAYALSVGRGDYAVARRGVYLYDTPYSIHKKLVTNLWLEQCKDYVNNSLAGGTIALRKLFPAKIKG